MDKGERTIWVGKNKTEAKIQEKAAIIKYGDAILSSGAIILNGKETFGYAVSVPGELYKPQGLGLFR